MEGVILRQASFMKGWGTGSGGAGYTTKEKRQGDSHKLTLGIEPGPDGSETKVLTTYFFIKYT